MICRGVSRKILQAGDLLIDTLYLVYNGETFVAGSHFEDAEWCRGLGVDFCCGSFSVGLFVEGVYVYVLRVGRVRIPGGFIATG